MKRLTLGVNDPFLTSHRYSRTKNFHNLALITLLLVCLLQAGKAHASEFPDFKGEIDFEPLNMVCKSIGASGYDVIKNSEEYKPARFKNKNYIVIDSKKELENVQRLKGLYDEYKNIVKILIFKDDMDRKKYYRCGYFSKYKDNKAFFCTAGFADKIIINENNLRYTKVYGEGWAIYNGDSIYIEYGNCSRLE